MCMASGRLSVPWRAVTIMRLRKEPGAGLAVCEQGRKFCEMMELLA